MTEPKNKTSKRPLWLIIAITFSVLVGGFLLFPNSDEERDWLLSILGTNNQGTLLNPVVSLGDLSFTDQENTAWSWQEQTPKWRVLLPVVGFCDDECREFLYISRQVHVRLDKKTQRVRRVLLNLGEPFDDEMNAFLKKAHPYLTVIRGDEAAFLTFFAATNAKWSDSTSRLFVVDQQGVAMLFYTPEHEGSDLLTDLKHLLKYSPEL